MNRDPFLRLALIVSVSAYAVAIAAIWERFSWSAAVAGLAGGVLGAAALTVSLEPSPAREPRFRRRRQPADGTKGFERLPPP